MGIQDWIGEVGPKIHGWIAFRDRYGDWDVSLSGDEDEDDEEDTEPNWELEYGFTDWFPKKIKPVRTGIYEVTTDSWPFPQKCEWDGKKWNHLGGAKITQWRGLAVDPESKFNTASNHLDLEKAMKELKEEFDRLQQTN